MPVGIPDRGRFLSIPSSFESRWTGNVQHHQAEKAGSHYDLRLSPPGSNDAFSWAIRNFPGPGQKTLAVEQPTHEASYMGYEGKIESGYGAGTVKSMFFDKIDVLESNSDKILFNMYRGQTVSRYMLKKTGDKNWLLYNYTGQIENDIPDYKPHYKSVKIDALKINEGNEMWAPKIDGAHNTVVIRPDKRLDVYSYRLSKKTGDQIDHTYKTDLYKIRGPRQLGNTIVRTELYIPGQDSATIGGVLNAGTWKSREKQKTLGKLKSMAIDIVKFKGKNVEKSPYKDKLKMLEEISKQIPELEMPPLAKTSQEKLKLKNDIFSGLNPLTREGLVVYKMDESVPYKSKSSEDFDVLIIGVFPAKAGSKYEGNAIGGFIGIPENSKVKIRIGSGLSDELRRDAYLNPNKYIGLWAKVLGQMQFARTGKFRVPVFKELRYEKYK
jgi:hypothetical protein